MIKNKLLKTVTAGLVTATFMLLTACGSSSKSGMYMANTPASYNGLSKADSYSAEAYYSDYDYVDYADYTDMASGTIQSAASEITVQETNRKLIRTIYMDCEIEGESADLSKLATSIAAEVKGFGGYVEDFSQNSSYVSFTIRVPAKNADALIENIEADANVTRHTESVEDVTLSYVDMESHKKMLEVEYERLLALLERAEDISDIMTIESRLTEVRYQIESMESQLRTYDNLVDYSTLHLSIQKVTRYTAPEELTFWEEIKEGLSGSLIDVGDGFLNFIVWFITALPHLLVWAVIITGIVHIIKRIVKNAKKKKAKKAASYAIPVAAPATAATIAAPANPASEAPAPEVPESK